MKRYNAFADFYDDIWTGIKGDTKFYLQEAKKARGPVLEAACGTGRIMLPLLEAGVDIDGFDITPKMISVLKKKAKAKGLKPNVWVADMRSFRSKRKYGLIIVPYRSFLHIRTTEDQIKTLKNFKRHLKKGGRLVMNFFYPDFNFMAKNDGKTSKKHPIYIKGKKYYSQEKVSISPIEQFNTVQWTLTGQGKTRKYSIDICYIYKKEFDLLLSAAGFRKWKVYGGFKKEKLTKMQQEMVWIIRN